MKSDAALLLTLVLAAACAPDREPGDRAAAAPPPGTYDWLIAGGTLVDGTGEAGRRADILVRDGRIAYIGEVDTAAVEARNRYDARGLIVAPGFIDAHAHGDPVDDPGFPNFLAMGVTTIVLGQDGGGPEAGTLPAHLDAVDAANPAVNIAYLIGHNTIRRESGVGYGEPGPEGLARMARLVERALEAGAFGLSTGLEYDPGSRARLDELVAIARPVAAAGGVVMSHMRSEDADRVASSLAELIEQGRRAGVRVHASHLKIVLGRDPAQATALLDAMAAARADGVRITADVYPYTASYTGIGILFPDWARPPADYATVRRERRDELTGYLRRRVEARNGPRATLFGSGDWAGRTLADVANELGRPFEEVLLEIGPRGANAAYFVMDEDVMATFLRDDHVAISSDGSPTMLHPRGYGSFARVIRRYVVEERMLTIEEAVRKMSGLTASIVGLSDPARVDVPRGLVREGWAADLVAFDPAEVRDAADFTDPHRPAEGMRAVWVGGALAWRDGRAVEGPGNGTVIRARGRAVASSAPPRPTAP
ncbi:MAG TPA: amidohydrolase family protein [Longimicrobiales bacterium]